MLSLGWLMSHVLPSTRLLLSSTTSDPSMLHPSSNRLNNQVLEHCQLRLRASSSCTAGYSYNNNPPRLRAWAVGSRPMSGISSYIDAHDASPQSATRSIFQSSREEEENIAALVSSSSSVLALVLIARNRDPQDVVGLYAGEGRGEKPLNIHKDVACFYSPVFKAAFNSQFIEGEEQKYRLEDTNPRTVRLLIHVSPSPAISRSSTTCPNSIC
jgi:hypothetical protein